MSHTRERICDHVTANPGVHFRALVRDLDLATGQVQYHLRRLCRAGRLVGEEVDGRTHYFDPAVDSTERRQLAVCRRETARDVLLALAEDGPARPASVANAIGVARSTLEYHLDRLVAVDLVEKRRDDAGWVTLVLADDALVARRLDAVTPTTSERLVDRFTRLVDGLLNED